MWCAWRICGFTLASQWPHNYVRQRTQSATRQNGKATLPLTKPAFAGWRAVAKYSLQPGRPGLGAGLATAPTRQARCLRANSVHGLARVMAAVVSWHASNRSKITSEMAQRSVTYIFAASVTSYSASLTSAPPIALESARNRRPPKRKEFQLHHAIRISTCTHLSQFLVEFRFFVPACCWHLLAVAGAEAEKAPKAAPLPASLRSWPLSQRRLRRQALTPAGRRLKTHNPASS